MGLDKGEKRNGYLGMILLDPGETVEKKCRASRDGDEKDKKEYKKPKHLFHDRINPITATPCLQFIAIPVFANLACVRFVRISK
jgi:hypothetical protein